MGAADKHRVPPRRPPPPPPPPTPGYPADPRGPERGLKPQQLPALSQPENPGVPLQGPGGLEPHGSRSRSRPGLAQRSDYRTRLAEDLGVHQLERLVELLTSRECEDLLSALSSPDQDVFQHLKHLLPENNQLDLQPRVRRDAPSADDKEAECRTALTDWLLRNGEQIYYDRLSRALQHIGRSDIAVEVGKNINQDKALSLKRHVEDYHKHVSRLQTLERRRPPREGRKKKRAMKVKDLTWRDLDLVLERAPVLLRRGGVLAGARPLLYGVLLGAGGTFLLTLIVLHTVVYVSRGRRGPA
ncbi:unnamed protein product [Merluccius merluccius]